MMCRASDCQKILDKSPWGGGCLRPPARRAEVVSPISTTRDPTPGGPRALPDQEERSLLSEPMRARGCEYPTGQTTHANLVQGLNVLSGCDRSLAMMSETHIRTENALSDINLIPTWKGGMSFSRRSRVFRWWLASKPMRDM